MATKYKRNKWMVLLMCALSCLLLLSGCGKADKKEAQLPDAFPMELVFSSGAGAWRTSIIMNRDGSFEGQYTDSEMGDGGTDYPHGSVYICDFSGKFENIEKVDDHTYSMTLADMTLELEEGKIWIEDEIRYLASEPYGMESGKEYLFYTPQTPIEGLSEEFLTWWPGWYYADSEEPGKLNCYGLYNEEMEYGFFTFE